MGNNNSNQNDYRQLPTQSYINYVVQKNLEVWEKTVKENKTSEDNSKTVVDKNISKKTVMIFVRL